MPRRSNHTGRKWLLLCTGAIGLAACANEPPLQTSTPAPVDTAQGAQATPPYLQSIAAVVDGPLAATPLDLRRRATEILAPYAKGDPTILDPFLLQAILTDHETVFADEGRLVDASPFEHDADLVGALLERIRSGTLPAEVENAFREALPIILKADRHMAELALADSEHVVASAHQVSASLAAEDLTQAQEDLARARFELGEARAALLRAEAVTAIAHFRATWEASATILSLLSITYDGDRDADGLPELLEFRIQSSPFSVDTDSEGLPDSFEFHTLIPHALPNSLDTDGDGQPDGAEDLDSDGLDNAAELLAGTDPLLRDTDDDGLNDAIEVQDPSLDPLSADSDGDGLGDASELRLGSDPGSVDTDGDGVRDGEDTHSQTIQVIELGVTIELEGVGDHSETLSAQINPSFDFASGLVGTFVTISTSRPFSHAWVTLRFDPSLVPGSDYANLGILFVDPPMTVELLANATVDALAYQIRGETTKLGHFGVIHVPTWEAALGEPP